MNKPLNDVAYHMSKLRKLKLLHLVKSVQRRGVRERFYVAEPVAIDGELPRNEIPRSVRSHVSAPTLQKIIDAGVAALNEGTLDARDDSHLICIPAVLDPQAWKEVGSALDQALTKIARARAQSAMRLGDADDGGIRTTVVLASFESPEPRKKER